VSEHAIAVRLQRRIPANPDQVYRAWLEPELVRRWFAPEEMAVSNVEIDARVGGHFRVWQQADGVDVGGFVCANCSSWCRASGWCSGGASSDLTGRWTRGTSRS
jgi:hypothetical protein